MLKLFISVFIGGGLGSVARYGMGLLVVRCFSTAFPAATLAVNLLGSFLIGVCWGSPLTSSRGVWFHLLAVGFCGGFTTFSAFSWEGFSLIRQGNVGAMLLYAAASIVLCLLAAWGGYATGKLL